MKGNYITVNELRNAEIEWEFRTTNSNVCQESIRVNEAAREFAKAIIQVVPWSVDRDRAVQSVREAAIWAREALQTHEAEVEVTTKNGHKLRFLDLGSAGD